MNITQTGFYAYIETFFETLETTAKEYLDPDLHSKLFHLSLLPARITGYVSTQYGVAIEYHPADSMHVEVVAGSARVEDLMVHAPHKLRGLGPGVRVSGRGIYLGKHTVSGCFPFRMEGNDASLYIDDLAFEAGSWKGEVHFAELYACRTALHWSQEKAISRAKDEVLAALVEANRAAKESISIDEYIACHKSKTVLLLGDYDDPGLERLHSISEVLCGLGYSPLLVRDIPDSPYQDLAQKVVAIGSIARFVMVDDSSKSGHLYEARLCQDNKWVTILLRADGLGGSWMTAGSSIHSSVVLEKAYEPMAPERDVKDAVAWAEEKLTQLQDNLNRTYPWRQATR